MEHSIQYGTQEITFGVDWRNRKTLAIEVHPDLTVIVLAPLKTNLQEVQEKVLKRARWIIKQWAYFDQFLPRTPEREYVSGESHLYLGKKYLLKIRQGESNLVKLRAGNFEVTTSAQPNQTKVKQLLSAWYQAHSTHKFEEAFASSQSLFQQFNLEPELEIRRMKNRWGSCTPSGKIMLNPEIIKAPSKCIEYVIVHELCHLVHPDHSRNFYSLLESVLPGWQRWKLRLEKSLI
ncbi:MAG: metal-dependent hydrolase [Cytophagales bacterium CG12_big_fil_rev_8_21_14_0_65_40_12]|nr:MAG: metal-dependent hydrolase [Cytophagales bacterium CG12_big_fil_rev_8_21_14_0_65_40_12]PIW03147.1 MAG: M48 family peptidase [Cytophagales bacterium CG17_big_fil_post_rev_8_21_14_2_50_40_13]